MLAAHGSIPATAIFEKLLYKTYKARVNGITAYIFRKDKHV